MGEGKRLALTAMLFLASVQPLTAFAGSINGNEQEFLNVISGTETYNGRTYRMKEEYIIQARAYFLQDDVDVTDEQKQKAIDTMYANIEQGIEEGYLIPVEEELPGRQEASGGETGAGEERGEPQAAEPETTEPETTEPETTEPETTEPETTLSPAVLALETVEVTEAQEPLEDFPLDELQAENPVRMFWAAGGAAGVCLAAGWITAVRQKLFRHHYSRKEKGT